MNAVRCSQREFGCRPVLQPDVAIVDFHPVDVAKLVAAVKLFSLKSLAEGNISLGVRRAALSHPEVSLVPLAGYGVSGEATSEGSAEVMRSARVSTTSFRQKSP
jgi:hypothetical protein